MSEEKIKKKKNLEHFQAAVPYPIDFYFTSWGDTSYSDRVI